MEDDLNDSQLTIPYSYDMGYRISYDPQISSWTQSSTSELEIDGDDEELLTHRVQFQTDLAPFSNSFVEEEVNEVGEEEEESDGRTNIENADVEQFQAIFPKRNSSITQSINQSINQSIIAKNDKLYS